MCRRSATPSSARSRAESFLSALCPEPGVLAPVTRAFAGPALSRDRVGEPAPRGTVQAGWGRPPVLPCGRGGGFDCGMPPQGRRRAVPRPTVNARDRERSGMTTVRGILQSGVGSITGGGRQVAGRLERTRCPESSFQPGAGNPSPPGAMGAVAEVFAAPRFRLHSRLLS